jgi:hypothetical protein|tara:strand:- start:912 stop:1874 length:963 start_codon:yes stop_codon:yes gene_type:complete
MKEDQAEASEWYLPSSMWQEHIAKAYWPLHSGWKENAIHRFHHFLTNFGAWKVDTGIEASALIRSPKWFMGRLYLQRVFHRQLMIWKWMCAEEKPIACLTYPMYGNQSGAHIEGEFVGMGSFFSEIYGSLLAGLVRHIERPVIADLGAGYGKLAYFILRELDTYSFVDFDLPETLCLAAYYLMSAFPGRRTLLYGEENYSVTTHEKYDFVFMPPWEMEKLGRSSIDLFVNKNSLGEMRKDAVSNYIKHITNSTRFFFHMNHDITRCTFSDGKHGLLGHEFPVAMGEFSLLFRYPDIGHLLYQGFLNFNMDIFLYLYERKP